MQNNINIIIIISNNIWRCTDWLTSNLQRKNIKSAKKRILVIETKTLRNKSIKSKVKTCIKNVEVAVAKGDKEAAQAALTVAISEISKATSKGIFHKNTAARKVSRLTKAVNGIA